MGIFVLLAPENASVEMKSDVLQDDGITMATVVGAETSMSSAALQSK